MNHIKVTKLQVIQILDLYTCCPDNELRNIAKIVNLSQPTISRIISDYLNNSINFYQKPNNLLILHSSINTQQ